MGVGNSQWDWQGMHDGGPVCNREVKPGMWRVEDVEKKKICQFSSETPFHVTALNDRFDAHLCLKVCKFLWSSGQRNLIPNTDGLVFISWI